MLYSHLQHHNDTIIIKTDARRKIGRRNEGRMKTSLTIYSPLSLYCKGSKGLFNVCMGEGAGDRT